MSFILKNAHGTHLMGNDGKIASSPYDKKWETWTIEHCDDKVVLRDHNGHYLCADPTNIVKSAPHAKEWETWTIIPHPTAPGKFAFLSFHNTYMCAQPDGSITLAEHAKEWEAWEMIPKLPEGHVILRNYHGAYLQGNDFNVAAAPVAKHWETWTLEQHDDKITLHDHSGHYLCANPDTSVSCAPHAKEWEHWTVVAHPTVPGKFAFLSFHNTYLCAHADGHITLAPHAKEWEAWEIARE